MSGIRTCLVVLVVGIAASCRGNVLPVTWSSEYHSTGPNDTASCLVRWQGDVVVAGRFDAIGRVATPSHVARLRDGAWEPLGELVSGSEVVALVVHEDALHALVKEGTTLRVVRFDGGQWLDVGAPCPTSSTAIASYQGGLHVGSHRLEGGVWVDRLQAEDAVLSLVVMDDLLVAGGEFTSGAGVATGHVLAWDGASVIAAFAGQDSTVTDLAVWNDQLFAARSAGGPVSIAAVQVWQGGAWVDIPALGDASFARRVTDLEAGDGRLVVCGFWVGFLVKEGSRQDADRSWFGAFARAWDGAIAETLSYEEGSVEYWQILDDGDDILVAGDFTTVGQPTCAHLGRVVEGAVTPVCEPGLGAADAVSVLQISGNAMVAGGSFASIGGLFSRNVAVLEAGAWSARDLDNGEEIGEYSSFRTVGWHGGNLYVVAEGHTGGGAGYWSGGQWNMTTPTWDYPWCHELLSWGGMLLGDGGGDGVLRFGSLASPTTYAEVDGRVIDLAHVGPDLVVGGEFEFIAGVAAANVAIRTDGTWQPLGDGLPDQVRAVGSWQGQPVAATWRGDSSGVYLFAGGQWDEIGALAGGVVTSVVEFDGLLFLGGNFDSPADDGISMVGLACWTGSQWRSVGEVADVRSMAVHDERLWLGGSFHFAGGAPAWHLASFTVDDVTGVAEADLARPNSLQASLAPNPFNPRTTISFNLPAPANVRLDVYDARGLRMTTLVDGHRGAGPHEITWDGRDPSGRNLPSGIYLLRLEAGPRVSTAKMVLAR